MLDYAGNKLNSANTANCYIIRKKGTYQIPLVYGNAIKNDQINTESFYTEGIATNFEDSYGVSFTASSSPYIKDHASVQGKSIASAELLWNDGTSTITNLSVDENFLTFDVGTFSPSNALIAVKDNDGTILWSWHLWLTDTDLTPKVITNADGVDFKIMPCNLGWNGWTTENSNPRSTAPYYQWGRKDPFIPVGSPTSGGNIEYSSSAGAQFLAHKNPKVYYHNPSSYSWTTDNFHYFWDADNTATSADSPVVKTIYDPCPAGWNVPQYGTFTGFSRSNAIGSFNKGWTFKKDSGDDEGIFFPAAGSRYCGSASIKSVTSYGGCWVSTSDNFLFFDQAGVGTRGVYDFNRSEGFCVWPALSQN